MGFWGDFFGSEPTAERNLSRAKADLRRYKGSRLHSERKGRNGPDRELRELKQEVDHWGAAVRRGR